MPKQLHKAPFGRRRSPIASTAILTFLSNELEPVRERYPNRRHLRHRIEKSRSTLTCLLPGPACVRQSLRWQQMFMERLVITDSHTGY